MKRRSKTIAFSAAGAGTVVLLIASIRLPELLREEWYLRDLEAYDFERSRIAAEWFAANGSRRALGRLADLVRKLAPLPDAEDASSGTCNSLVRIGQAQEGIAVRRGVEVVPLLVALLKEKPACPIPGNEVRIGAANFLGKIGPGAQDAIPALQEALKDDEERFRRYAAKALWRIQGEEHAAQR